MRFPLRSSSSSWASLALKTAAIVLLLAGPGFADHHAGDKPAPGSSGAPSKPKMQETSDRNSALMNPKQATEKAPDQFRAEFETTAGKFIVEVNRAWSPNGADRFYNLVRIGFFEDIAFFRVIDGFMAQFGIHGDPKIARRWKTATIKDDKVVSSNTRGTISFAKTGAPNSRSTQFFINFGDNVNLDGMGFSPFARVTQGMEAVDRIHKVGEGRPRGPGPNQQQIQARGNTYLKSNFPKLDYIKSVRLLPSDEKS